MQVNRDKLMSTIAHIAGRTPTGKLKLFKLMFLADFACYARLGRSITGEMYENFEMGPVPRTLWKEFAAIAGGCVEITELDTGVLPEQRMTPKSGVEPQSALDGAELAVLDDIIDQYGALSGNQLKHLTHQMIPYLATDRGDAIPYGLAAYTWFKKATHADVDRLVSRPDVHAGLLAALHAADAAR